VRGRSANAATWHREHERRVIFRPPREPQWRASRRCTSGAGPVSGMAGSRLLRRFGAAGTGQPSSRRAGYSLHAANRFREAYRPLSQSISVRSSRR